MVQAHRDFLCSLKANIQYVSLVCCIQGPWREGHVAQDGSESICGCFMSNNHLRLMRQKRAVRSTLTSETYSIPENIPTQSNSTLFQLQEALYGNPGPDRQTKTAFDGKNKQKRRVSDRQQIYWFTLFMHPVFHYFFPPCNAYCFMRHLLHQTSDCPIKKNCANKTSILA